MPDPTPIPAEALEAAAKVAFRHYESEYTAAPNMTWRDFVPEVRELVEAAAPALLAAGRTAAAADALMAARDDLVGVADRLRAKARETGDKAHVGMAAGVDLACFRLVELADRAARVAENGADRG